MTAWHGLLANLAILAIFITIWTQASDALDRMSRWGRASLQVTILGSCALAVMSLPFPVSPGVFADLRSAMLVLGGFFGGALVGGPVLLVTASYRLWLGGLGAQPAVWAMAVALAIGLIGREMLHGRIATNRDVITLAFAGAAGSISGFFLLPAELKIGILVDIGLPLSTVTLVAISVAGLAIARDERRMATERQNRLYAAIIDALPDALNAKDLDGRFIAANPATAALMRAGRVADLIGKRDSDFYPMEVAARLGADETAMMASGRSTVLRQHVVFDDGSNVWLSTTKAPFRDRDGTLVGVITSNRNISARKQLEDEKEALQQRLSDAIANMADGLAMFDAEGRILMCNRQYTALFPITADLRVPGAGLANILRASIERGEEPLPPGFDIETWIAETVAALHEAADSTVQLSDGRWLQARVRPQRDGTSLTVFSDVTAAKRSEERLAASNLRLETLSRTDGLTGLANRRAFDEALMREFARAARTGDQISVLIADVDRFKAYNDSYGHQQGDACLKEVAACLARTLKRPIDLAARYGGEEFVALLPETDAVGALILAETFRQSVKALALPHRGSAKGVVTITVGVATSGAEAIESPALLVRQADTALYAGKAGGRDRTMQAADVEPVNKQRVVAG